MAVLYITEYSRTGSSQYSQEIPAPLEPPVAEQTVSIGVASAQSSALNNTTRLIAVHADAICHIAIAANPTATTSNRRIPADGTWFVCVPPESGFKIAVIEGT
jgi:hypothetical protein